MERETFTLIQGEFQAEDARDILLTLIDNKIKFHEMRNFSSQERFGRADGHSQERLSALRKSRSQVMQLIQQALTSGKLVQLDSAVTMILR